MGCFCSVGSDGDGMVLRPPEAAGTTEKKQTPVKDSQASLVPVLETLCGFQEGMTATDTRQCQTMTAFERLHV